MNILKNIFLFNQKSEINKDICHEAFDHYMDIAKLVKEAIRRDESLVSWFS